MKTSRRLGCRNAGRLLGNIICSAILFLVNGRLRDEDASGSSLVEPIPLSPSILFFSNPVEGSNVGVERKCLQSMIGTESNTLGANGPLFKGKRLVVWENTSRSSVGRSDIRCGDAEISSSAFAACSIFLFATNISYEAVLMQLDRNHAPRTASEQLASSSQPLHQAEHRTCSAFLRVWRCSRSYIIVTRGWRRSRSALDVTCIVVPGIQASILERCRHDAVGSQQP